MGKRLMVLGASVAQRRAILWARAAGHTVIVADRNPDAPCARMGHHFAQASTFDEGAVLRAARNHRADGLLVVATDQPVLVASRVCAELGLPCHVDPDTALLVTHKGVMKDRLRDAGIPSPASVLVAPEESAIPAGAPDQVRLPVVVKPVDNQGQRGVRRCSSWEEVWPAVESARQFSRAGRVLIEEYYKGTEVTVSGWVTDGALNILAVTDRVTLTNNTSLGVCCAHRLPSAYARPVYREVVQQARDVVAAFGLIHGPLYVQLLIGGRGPQVNEVACRVGGAFEDISIPAATGVDILRLAIDDALGETQTPLAFPNPKPAHTRVFSTALLYCREGTIGSLSNLEPARRLTGVHAAEWLQPTGTTIREMRDSSQRAGYAVVTAPDSATLNRRLQTLWPHFSVTSEAGEELLLPSLQCCLHPAH